MADFDKVRSLSYDICAVRSHYLLEQNIRIKPRLCISHLKDHALEPLLEKMDNTDEILDP